MRYRVEVSPDLTDPEKMTVTVSYNADGSEWHVVESRSYNKGESLE